MSTLFIKLKIFENCVVLKKSNANTFTPKKNVREILGTQEFLTSTYFNNSVKLLYIYIRIFSREIVD